MATVNLPDVEDTLPKGWVISELEECIEKVLDYRGKTPRKVGGDWSDRGFRAISAKNIKNGRLVSIESIRFVDEVIYDKWMKDEVKKEDILLTSEAPLGEILFWDSDEKIVLSQRVFGIRANKAKVYPKYLNAYMHSAFFRQELNRRATGTTVLGIRQTELLKTAVILPLMSEQIQIGDLYSHISDKIGLNAQLNQTLEDMARAIFKSWFVDFDPVRAKVAGKPTGLPKEISDLFPSRLVHSDLGEIPEGWREKHLSEIASSIRGKSYTSNDLQEAENALVTLKSFSRGGGYRADGLKSYSGGYKPEQVVSPGEIVVSCTDVTQNAEVIGRPAIVRTDKRYKLLIASQDLMIVRPKLSAVGVGYLYCLLRTDAFTNHTYAHSTGTTVLHLFKEAVPTFTFCCPTEPIIKVFSSIADSIYKKIDLLGLETENLTLIRDTLLPKLMSGEIRVNQ